MGRQQYEFTCQAGHIQIWLQALSDACSVRADKLCPPSLSKSSFARSKSSVGTQKRVFRPCRYGGAAVQTLVNCHCQLEENPVENVEPVQLVVRCLTKTAIKLPSVGDSTRSSVQHPL